MLDRSAPLAVMALTAFGVAAGMVSGCAPRADAAAVEACEAYIKARLRSPSTFQRIEASAFLAVDGRTGWARIEYDAANAYGTPVRETQPCSFATPGGTWPAREELLHRARLAAAGGDHLCCMDGDQELGLPPEDSGADNIAD